MAVKRDKLERIGMGLVLCIALLMFYAPLVVLHGAFSGDESINALSVRSTLSQLRSGIETPRGFPPIKASSPICSEKIHPRSNH